MENIFNPAFFTPLSQEVQGILQGAVADSISTVFRIVFGTAILTLLSGLLIREGNTIVPRSLSTDYAD